MGRGSEEGLQSTGRGGNVTHDPTPCYEANCKHLGRCDPLWGKDCRMLGGTKIPRVTKNTHYREMLRAEEEEKARQQAVRDQLRAAERANEVHRRPYWIRTAGE